ncbi:hypothetical protein [Streptomyces sp. JH34]|uniref:hypothetical protein n=1 Tax=Streptomyces sp. JH34 TaxID=2793633 RepID=UPI0023F66F67|nr:hypothetical protein [Streptomyces sp. JH34]MDF6018519.1 hypothetical protein [Streptomyces sp. JH34]
MPLENDTENDTGGTSENRFETDLGEIMRYTGGTFVADRRALLETGAIRGRRKAARRRATALTAGVLTLTVLGTAGVYATGGFGGDSVSVADATPTWAPSLGPEGGPSLQPGPSGESGPTEDSTSFMRAGADQMIKLLEISLPALPKGEFSKQRGTSNEGGPGVADASMVYDDGYGASLVAISARRVDPEDPMIRQLVKCGKTSNGSTCALGSGGGKTEQGHVGGGSGGGVKVWKSTRISADGFLLQAIEYNAPSSTGTPTRAEPPLSPLQLHELTGCVERAFTKYGVMNAEAFTSPRPVQNSWEVFETLGGLVPAGYEEIGRGGGGDEGYVIVRDKKTKTKTFLRVRLGHGTADGGKVVTRSEAGLHSGTSGLTAETVTAKGLRVTVTSYNAEYPHKAPALPAPPFTGAQLSAIATDGVWQTLK